MNRLPLWINKIKNKTQKNKIQIQSQSDSKVTFVFGFGKTVNKGNISGMNFTSNNLDFPQLLNINTNNNLAKNYEI